MYKQGYIYTNQYGEYIVTYINHNAGIVHIMYRNGETDIVNTLHTIDKPICKPKWFSEWINV